jgi:hypothetical protein
MNDFNAGQADSAGRKTSVVRTSPLGRAKAISGLISEEALASERLGRLTDKVAAALLNADLFSIWVPEVHGGLGGTGMELFESCGGDRARRRLGRLVRGDQQCDQQLRL